jgi:hypothetical protein
MSVEESLQSILAELDGYSDQSGCQAVYKSRRNLSRISQAKRCMNLGSASQVSPLRSCLKQEAGTFQW